MHPMGRTALLLGVDGGGTGCRARLTGLDGTVLGEGTAGPANIRFGIPESMMAVLQATDACLAEAGASVHDPEITACLALAGASEPSLLAAARAYKLPFHHTLFTNDAYAACVGAHAGEDGGIIVIGTGSVGWGIVGGREHRVGGWGFPVSDEGSGAWLGCEAARRVLWAYDGRAAWSPLLRDLYARFGDDPHAIVRWMGAARPREFAMLAPAVIDHAAEDDVVAAELMGLAADHIDAIARQLVQLGVIRLALTGGIAAPIEPWLSPATKAHLVAPQGDALSGALRLARMEAEATILTQALKKRG
jgi:glucosamine kinase